MTERVDEIRMIAGELVAGRYRLTAPARDGAGHALWRAQDEILGREVAVRLVCGGAEKLAALHAAATRAGRLVHDGVAAIYDTGSVGQCVYIVREWVPGEALQTLVAAGPLDSRVVSEIGVQLADILSAVTTAGLRHQRLHLGNVIVTPNGGVKITDLETADVLESRHASEARWFGGVLYGALTARWPYRLLPAPAGLPEAVRGDDGRLSSPTQLRAGVPSVLDVVTMRALTASEFAAAPTDPDDICRLAAPLKNLPRSSPAVRLVDDLPLAEPSGSARPTRERRAWLALGLATASAVVVLLWLAARIAGPTGPIPFFQAQEPAAATRTPPKPAASTSGPVSVSRAPAIAGVHDYDPFGDDGQEDPTRVALTFNNNPDDGWYTDGYKAPLSLIGKKGVGLVVDLGKQSALHDMTVLFAQPGTTWELRTAGSASPDFAATTVVGQGSKGSTTSVATVPAGTESRYWLVWLTVLPQTADGTYRSEIREIAPH